jgi:hypothetical protein
MKAAEDRLGCDDAEALNRPMEWGILVQRAMNARFIIIRGIPTQDPAQVRLPKYDHVVETFPSDRADQSLDVRVLPRRSRSSRLVPNAHGTQPLPEDAVSRSRIRYLGELSQGNASMIWREIHSAVGFVVTPNDTHSRRP